MAIQNQDYVDEAEKVMRKLGQKDRYDERKLKFSLTTTKIRSILALGNEIYNEESLRKEGTLSPNSIAKIQMMRVRILYDSGRDPVVKSFVEASDLLEKLKAIKNSRDKFIEFSRYLEALVAYHRYLGGDN